MPVPGVTVKLRCQSFIPFKVTLNSTASHTAPCGQEQLSQAQECVAELLSARQRAAGQDMSIYEQKCQEMGQTLLQPLCCKSEEPNSPSRA